MEKFVLYILLSFFALGLNAQIQVSETEIFAEFQGQDLTDNWLDLETKFAVTNTTDEEIAIKWERNVTGNCDGLETGICDNNTCYFPGVSSNIMDGLNEPFILLANETFDAFAVHIYPRMNAGCCDVTMSFSLVEDPDNILATTVVYGNVNMDENCEFELTPNSIQDAEALAALKAFPNPTQDYFSLTPNESVASISLRNTLGQELRTYNYSTGGQYNVSDMNTGIYYLQLQDEAGATLKLVPLTIHAK